MKVAVLSISKNGKKLSKKLKSLLDNDPTIIRTDIFHKNVKSNINLVFKEYDVIIGIMATGILVRNISKCLRSKYSDPAVLSIDDNGKFVISLLSGHMGGGNKFTKKIANLLSSQDVITTATDINGKIGIDVLANHFYWDIINQEMVLTLNKAILENEILHLISNSSTIKYLEEFFLKNPLEHDNNIKYNHLKEDFNSKDDVNSNEVIISNEDIIEDINEFIKTNYHYVFEIDESLNNKVIAKFQDVELELKPRKLVLGIGTRKNISEKDVCIAINKAMNNLAIYSSRIDCIATASIKKNELAIINTAKTLNKPLKIVEKEKINDFFSTNQSRDCLKSSFVKKKFGIDGVCEPCALITCGKDSKLIHRKIAINGVTIAIAVSKQS